MATTPDISSPETAGSRVRAQSEGTMISFQTEMSKTESSMSRSPTGKTRKSWRALGSDDKSGQTVLNLHMDIDLDKFEERQNDINSAAVIKKVEARRNVAFDATSGKASLLRDVKFKSRWYGQERVDEPTAEWDNLNFARAVASDLSQVYKAFPGDCQLVRLRRPVVPGAYTAEREAWMQTLAQNQGDKMKAILVDSGIPAESIKVSVEFAGPSAPGGMFYLAVPSQSVVDTRVAREACCENQTKMVVGRNNVNFDFVAGRTYCVKEVAWKSRYCGSDKMEVPSAELADPDLANKVFDDMAAVWNIWQVPAKVYVDVPDMGTGDQCMEEWFRTLGRNRALFVQQALQDRGVPRGQLEGLINGEKQDKARRSRSASHAALACTCSGPPSPEMRSPALQSQKIRIKAKLQKAAVVHRVEDIPLLEEALAEARRLRLEEHWSRVDSLISDAENNLKVLYQRKRRQQAWDTSKDRTNALSKVNVSQATKQNMEADGLQLLPVQAF